MNHEMKTIKIAILCLFIGLIATDPTSAQQKPKNPYYSRTDQTKLKIGNKEWKKILEPNLYAVAREAATERAFTGKYNEFDAKGTYFCAVCGNRLFRSDSKFASTC